MLHLVRARVVSLLAVLFGLVFELSALPQDQPVQTEHALLFVTQVPIASDYLTVCSTFGNHRGTPKSVPRGGDLWIRYGTGELRNLTAEAGFGSSGPFQGVSAIAVREPCVHWSGTRAVFSMLVGAPTTPQEQPFYWQLYEVTGYAPRQTPRITRVPFQPPFRNNVSPCYASDGRILFTSDRMRGGTPHIYPQLDEYEEAPTTTGIWSLDPVTGDSFQLDHAPSGAFHPIVDRYGRVVFTRWDHLERDQQADLDRLGFGNYRVANWTSEAPDAVPTGNTLEFFPEARPQWISYVNRTPGYSGLPYGWRPYLTGNTFNHFLPWTLNQDGTGEETLNHIGRNELFAFVPGSRNDDYNVTSQPTFPPWVSNRLALTSLHQMREIPRSPGSYLGIDCREFDTHAAGQIVRITGAPGLNPNEMQVQYVTHRDTQSPTQTPGPNHSGLYRNPLALEGGRWIAAHTTNTLKEQALGPPSQPISRYDFRLKTLALGANGYAVAGQTMTSGIHKRVQYLDPFHLVTFDGELWELDPVEVVRRPVPPATTESELELPEQRVLDFLGVELADLKQYLRARNLALIVSRNVTRRDKSDRMQPFNLRVPGGTETIGAPGTVYDVSFLRLFQGDLVRGLQNGVQGSANGRRVLAKPLHDGNADNVPAPGGGPGSVAIAADGSVAALVPALRAMTWQLVDPNGHAVVNERVWLSFQPGEIRTCTSCHGVNELDQADQPPPTNSPLALGLLLQRLKANGSL